MNSGYGKSIQKPIKTDTRFVRNDNFNHYASEHYHNIEKIEPVAGTFVKAQGDNGVWMVTLRKSLDKQFNNCLFGVSVLSMSKRIMNEVMCLAEDIGANIYYQDTDSMHIERSALSALAEEYRKVYNRELIGENIMGCFHNDFDALKDAYCTYHISLGKKMYYDTLTNDAGQTAEHFRMKGIPNDVIRHHADMYFNGSVKALYEYLYEEGNSIEFDLLATKVSFKMEKSGRILHKQSFKRRVKATAPM
jgi:hypothetical protein